MAWLIAALSITIRLPWTLLAEVTPVSDFAGYDSLATHWLDTGDFGFPNGRAYRTPGYPGFLAALYAIFGHDWRVAQVCQAFLGAYSSAAIVLLASRMYSPRTAGLAGLLHAVWPTTLAYTAVLASENLGIPLLLTSLLALGQESPSLASRLSATASAGVAFGLMVLARPAGVFFLPALALLAFFEFVSGRKRMIPLLAFLVAAGLVLAPWLVRNERLGLGVPTLSTSGGINLWMGNSPSARTGGFDGGYAAARHAGFPVNEAERDHSLRAAATAWIRSHPLGYLDLCRVRATRLVGLPIDSSAAMVLLPTAEVDAVLNRRRQSELDASTLLKVRRLQSLSELALFGLRVIAAPLMLLSLVLGVRQWKRYGPVLLPVFTYGAGIAATFMDERLREMWTPLFLVLLAPLLSDLLFNTNVLLRLRRRRIRIGLAVALIVIAGATKVVGLDTYLYQRLPSTAQES